MEGLPPAPAVQQNGTNQPSRGGRKRAPRRGRGRGGAGGDASLALRPASVAPGNMDQPNGEVPAVPSTNRGRNRRGRGGKVPERRTADGRQFGGRLTQAAETNGGPSTAANGIQADAPAFIPGQNYQTSNAPRPQPKGKQPRTHKRRGSKSQAPDIATRTHEDIDNGYYECPICTSEVQRNSKVWSCHDCWTVFHLTCIKKWSTNEGSAAARHDGQDGQPPPGRQWRCPGCNLPQDVLPKAYTCWCGKDTEPRSLAGLPPHSCGNTCGKERARKCPHPCQLTCHAGPCPPCSHMGPTQVCFCGKHEVTKRCSETDYVSGWSCGELCEELLPCGEHTCDRPCHEGLCGACETRVPARCYCGQTEKEILCYECGDVLESTQIHVSEDCGSTTESWTGMFECPQACDRTFDCGEHRCEKPCHPRDAEPAHCPRSPDNVTSCPCGKTPLDEISSQPRTSCSEPIPICNKPCASPLPCGHQCPRVCHQGDCPPCLQITEISCRCSRTSSKTVCHQGTDEAPQCMRICRANLSCGRHACEERCCTGERKAIQRQSTRRKQRPLNAGPARPIDDGFEAEHICTRECGRLLRCGTHACTELCHKGPCPTCREAIFEEIGCHCGRTVLQPPLPCGTKPPICRHPCNRPKACGHPQIPHHCHQDDEACPKCPFLVEKRCACGKKTLKNQQCWLQNVLCGQVCGATLSCGTHSCQRLCHKPGECEDAGGKPCTQPCGKLKKVCGHPDNAPCHSPYPCKEELPCQSKIFITCPCQAQKQEAKCLASKSSEGNNGKSLACNEECARLERNRKLAIALNIDQSSHVEGGDHIPYSAETINMFAEHVKWCQTQEREFRVFATSDDEKRLRFPPMKAGQRVFIHHLAEDFGFDSESMDPEPHRHVMIWKTPRFVSAPNKTLAECLRVRQAQRSAMASANVSDSEGPASSRNAKVNRSNEVGEPYNGFLISSPRFGLTVDELRSLLATFVPPSLPLTFDPEFLPSEEVVLKALSRSLNPHDLQQALLNLRQPLVTAVAGKGYGSAQLCTTDSSLNVLRRESDSTAAGEGWSRVAAKKAAPRSAPTQVSAAGGTNAFSALSAGGAGGAGGSGKMTFTKRAKSDKTVKKRQESVVDDWEAAEAAEEKKEEAMVPDAISEGIARKAFDGDMSEGVGEAGSSAGITEREAVPATSVAGPSAEASPVIASSTTEPSAINDAPLASVTSADLKDAGPIAMGARSGEPSSASASEDQQGKLRDWADEVETNAG